MIPRVVFKSKNAIVRTIPLIGHVVVCVLGVHAVHAAGVVQFLLGHGLHWDPGARLLVGWDWVRPVLLRANALTTARVGLVILVSGAPGAVLLGVAPSGEPPFDNAAPFVALIVVAHKGLIKSKKNVIQETFLCSKKICVFRRYVFLKSRKTSVKISKPSI